MAVPVGIALIGLGVSPWRDQRTSGTGIPAVNARIEQVTVWV